MAGVRVGRINGEFVINPTCQQRTESELDLVVAGTLDAVTMVEASAKELSEEVMIAAIAAGHDAIKEICSMIAELAEKVGKPKMEVADEADSPLLIALKERAVEPLKKALQTPGKFGRRDAAKQLRNEIIAEMVKPDEEGGPTESEIKDLWEEVTAAAVRGLLLEENKRLDGRSPEDIRDIDCRVGVLPCVHGSALFTRGETQAIVTMTLGTGADEQTREGLHERVGEKFYLHYNFLAFLSVRPRCPVALDAAK